MLDLFYKEYVVVPSIIPTTKIILTAQSHPQVFEYLDHNDDDNPLTVQYVPQLERWMVTYPDSRIEDLSVAIKEIGGLLEVLANTSIIELKTIIDKRIEDVKQTQLRDYLRCIGDMSSRLDNDIDKLTRLIQVQEIRKKIVSFIGIVYGISVNPEILRFFNDEMYTRLSISSFDVTQELKNFKNIEKFIKSVGYFNVDGTVLLGIKMEMLTDVPDVTKWAIDNLTKHLNLPV